MRLFNIRSIIYIILLILSVVLYFFTEARYAALLIVLLLLVLIGAIVTANVMGRMLSLSLATPIQGIRGEPAHVSIKVSNKSKLPVFLCRVKVTAENLLTDERDVFNHFLSIGRKKDAVADFMIKETRCGCIHIHVDDVCVSDPLGLLNVKPKSLEIENDGNGWIYFLPQAAQSHIPPENLSSYDMESYKYSRLKGGSDPSEIFDIREYQQNDSIKAIHWKLTSKMDELMIKEFGLPVENKVMIVVDKSIEGKENIEDRIEQSTDFISSLSFTLMQHTINHTIGWYNYLKGEFQTFRVDDESSFWTAVRELISCPYKEDDESAVSHFIESDSNRDFSSYIYVSDDGRDIERLMNYGAVSLYKPEEFK